MSRIAGLSSCLIASLFAAPLAAQVTLPQAPTAPPIAVTEYLYLEAQVNGGNSGCGGYADPNNWNIDAGPDGTVEFFSAGTDMTFWYLSWTDGGTKQVNVEYPDCGSASLDIEVNTCRFSQSTYQGPEGLSIEVVAERINGDNGYLDCEIFPSGGTATFGIDYGDPSSQLNWMSGEAGPKSVFIETGPDSDPEGDETIELVLTPYYLQKPAVTTVGNSTRIGSAGSFVSDTATVTIQDAGVCQFTQDSYPVSEGAGNAQIQVARAGGSAGSLYCQVDAFEGESESSATAGQDFVATSVPLSWADQESDTKTVLVSILDDEEEESSELVELELLGYGFGAVQSTPNGVGSGVRIPKAGLAFLDAAQIEIVDDDGAEPSTFSFVLAASDVIEGEPAHTIQVHRDGVDGEARVDVVVQGGTATPDDYTLETPVVLLWEDGQDGVREFQVTALADEESEGSETLVLALTNPLGPGSLLPTIGEPSTHELTISDPPEAGALRFTAESFSGGEGAGPVEIAVVRELGASGAVSVDVCFLEEGTADLEDVAAPSSTTLEWADGEEGERTLLLPVVDDAEIEGTETLTIELCDAAGDSAAGDPTIGEPATASVSIYDNDFETEDEIVIETADTGPEDPIVVYDREGRKIVVWVARDGDGFGVFAQLFDAEGEPIGPPFRVNASPAGDSTQPSAVIRDDGTIVIVWRQSGGDGARFADGRLGSAGGASGIVARGFSPTGGGSGGETVVSSSETGDVQNPGVGKDGDGEITITWEEGGTVRGQSFNASFQPRTPIVDVSDVAGASDPEVAVTASGDFVVVWKQAPGTAEGTILAQSFNDDGTRRGEQQIVTRNAQADEPAVAMDDQGNFFVAFTEPADGIDIFGRLFDRRGRRARAKFRVNAITAGDQTNPRVDMNSIGDIVVVWESSPGTPGAAGTGGGTSIVSRWFNPQSEPESSDVQVAESEAGTTVQQPDVSIEDEDETTVVFEKRGPGNVSEGIFSKVIRPSVTSGPCALADETLCVQGEQRFRILVEWQDFEGNSGEGQAVPLTDDSGYFWFFGPDNVEILIKVLDGCAINDRLWVFAGGLTNVEVNLRVDDTVAGITATYFSSLSTSFQPIIDVDAFDTCDAVSPPPAGLPPSLTEEIESWPRDLTASRVSGAGEAPCDGSEPTLCLRSQRFQATLLWESDESSGAGNPVALTDETGTFWFFDPDNVEAVIKVLDGCAINDHYWVFATGITDVGTDLQVVDSQTNASRSYMTELGTPFVPILDINAFECQ